MEIIASRADPQIKLCKFFNKKCKILIARAQSKGNRGLHTVDNSAYFAYIKPN